MVQKTTELDAIRLANLERLIEEVGTASTVAQRCGTSSAYISQLRRGVDGSGNPVRIGERIARKFETGLNKHPGWLDTLHNEEALDSSRPSTQLSDSLQPVYCPVVSWIQAGAFTRSPDALVDPEISLPCPKPCSQHTFALRVRGVSMEPKFQEGDLIFVDPKAPPTNGRFVVVVLSSSEEATFKQYVQEGGKTYLKALNPDWPDPIIELNEDAYICGVAIFKGEEV